MDKGSPQPDQPERRNEPARINVEQQVGAMVSGQVIGAQIGQATAQRDLIIQTFQTIHGRALTAEEAAKAAADLELELLAQGVRGLAGRLAAQAAAAPASGSPYKGLLAYGLGDADRFYGRAAATAALLALLGRGRLAALHAESGAGKSSLLQAGIAAQLIGAGRLAVCLRPYRANPTAAIKEAFMDLSRAPRLAGLPLREFLHYVTDILGPGETLYLLLDQFEEFYAYLDRPGRDAFAAELGACLNDASLNVRWLIALRGEALSRLAEMEAAGVEPFENEYRLARLTRAEAREVITGPGYAFEPALVEAMLDGLARNGEVAPPQLQLVCLALTEGLAPPAPIGRARYDQLGGADGILRDYLVRQVAQFPPAEREPVRRLLRTLVTADGRRAVLARSELDREWEASGGDRSLLDTLLTRLVERRLLVVQERPADGERTYELAHDTLLREIQLDPAEQARKAVQEMLDRAVLDYRANPRVLLDDDKFDAIHTRRGELILGPEAAELLRRSEAAVRRRRRLVRGGMALVAGLAIVAAVLTSAILGAQQRLSQTQNDITIKGAELARVGTEAAHGRATQAAVLATSEAIGAAGTAVAATATAAANRIQAKVRFEFDYADRADGPRSGVFLFEDPWLEIMADQVVTVVPQPIIPGRIILPESIGEILHVVSTPVVLLRSANHQSPHALLTEFIDPKTHKPHTVGNLEITFTDFSGHLGSLNDPTAWQGLTLKALMHGTSDDPSLQRASRGGLGQGSQTTLVLEPEDIRWITWMEGWVERGRPPLTISQITTSPNSEDVRRQMNMTIPGRLDLFVSGVRVTTLEGYVVSVGQKGEVGSQEYVVWFVGRVGK